jgi:hypothetical protein
MKKFLLLMLLAGAAHAQLDWKVCRSDWDLTSDQLTYHTRLRKLFHVDNDKAIVRFLIEPHSWGHYEPPLEAESSVAVYVPEEGDAIVEFALARQSVAESQRADVPVVFKRATIDRSLARSLCRRLHEDLRTPQQVKSTVIHFDASADYTVVIRDDGETICRSANGDVSGAELDSTWAGRLAALLRKTAETKAPRAESEAALRELMSVRVVAPQRSVIQPSPNETP